MLQEEIDSVRREAERIRERKAEDIAAVRRSKDKKLLTAPEDIDARDWAETSIRSPIDGVIIEKNVTIGDVVDTSIEMFKIVDLSQLHVMADAYEEDIAALRRLKPEQMRWKIHLTGANADKPIEGEIDRIIPIIDPTQHTGPCHRLAGQRRRRSSHWRVHHDHGRSAARCEFGRHSGSGVDRGRRFRQRPGVREWFSSGLHASENRRGAARPADRPGPRRTQRRRESAWRPTPPRRRGSGHDRQSTTGSGIGKFQGFTRGTLTRRAARRQPAGRRSHRRADAAPLAIAASL